MLGFLKRLFGGSPRSAITVKPLGPSAKPIKVELTDSPTPRRVKSAAPPVSITRSIPLLAENPDWRPLALQPKKDPLLKEWAVVESAVRLKGLSFRRAEVVCAITSAARRSEAEITLRREPENPHGSNAVAVDLERRFVGYLPAALANRLAPLMDARPDEVSFGLDVLWLDEVEGEREPRVMIALDLLAPRDALPAASGAAPQPLKLADLPDLALLAGAARADGRMTAAERGVILRYAESRVADWGMAFDPVEAEAQIKRLKKLEEDEILTRLGSASRMQPERKTAFMDALQELVEIDGEVSAGERRFLALAREALRPEDPPSA